MESLKLTTVYNLNEPKNLRPASTNHSLERTVPKNSKTGQILLRLLQNKPQPKPAPSKASFHSGLEQVMNRSTTQRTNISFYQPNRVSARSLSKNATSRMRTEYVFIRVRGSVLRETTNMHKAMNGMVIISPKVSKSPSSYSKYINLDSYLNSTKN